MSTRIPTVIRVGDRPEQHQSTGSYFDGETATAHAVQLIIEEENRRLKIDSGDAEPGYWALKDIRRLPDQAGKEQLVLCHCDDPLARLITHDLYLASRCPNIFRRVRRAPRARLIAWAAAALASVALIILVLVPAMANQLANYIPVAGERALGETTFNQIRSALDRSGSTPLKTCNNPEGRNALQALERRLTWRMADKQLLSVHVLDHEMLNAFALPGGYVVLFRGLIDKAETPEQVAAVFAHEMGHVVSRDPTRHALRSAGSIGVLGLLFGDFAGGALVLFLTEQLIEAQYSQGAELAADSFAQKLLSQAGVAPSALGDMFSHMLKDSENQPGALAHFLSHPDLQQRINASRTATPEDFAGQPILSGSEWAALKSICK